MSTLYTTGDWCRSFWRPAGCRQILTVWERLCLLLWPPSTQQPALGRLVHKHTHTLRPPENPAGLWIGTRGKPDASWEFQGHLLSDWLFSGKDTELWLPGSIYNRRGLDLTTHPLVFSRLNNIQLQSSYNLPKLPLLPSHILHQWRHLQLKPLQLDSLQLTFTVDKFTVETFTVETLTVETFTVENCRWNIYSWKVYSWHIYSWNNYSWKVFAVEKFTVETFTVEQFTVEKYTVQTFTVLTFTVESWQLKRLQMEHVELKRLHFKRWQWKHWQCKQC